MCYNRNHKEILMESTVFSSFDHQGNRLFCNGTRHAALKTNGGSVEEFRLVGECFHTPETRPKPNERESYVLGQLPA